jgi:hypothetical protein
VDVGHSTSPDQVTDLVPARKQAGAIGLGSIFWTLGIFCAQFTGSCIRHLQAPGVMSMAPSPTGSA